MQKMKFIPQIVFEIVKFKKSCNLIGQEHFYSQLENQNFAQTCGFNRITKATIEHHLPPPQKKHRLMGNVLKKSALLFQ